MLEFIQQLSDDQTAVVGCVGAIMGATLMLMISFHANPQNRQQAKSLSATKKLEMANKEQQPQRRRAA
ncbi:hypothetical protein KOR42_01830 [Thalassoglobus neptunius]|uniref:Uncharacterized protein n=1 Tax=Thalassoglobus neptunius TaxID=1938619 RepID=A0A5C5X1W8_9PLAN|nr:hypothetical protein [Thalassoglobus neptunius]TWT56828.1 hypothetical protein KOR42_01830 [Thalassoglobus neptunius]